MKYIAILLLNVMVMAAVAPDKQTDFTYPDVPEWVKEEAFDQGHKYADGMEPEAYDKAQKDFVNGYIQSYRNFTNKNRSLQPIVH